MNFIKICFFNLANFNQNLIENGLSQVPNNIGEKILRYRNKKDQIRGLCGKLILKKMLIENGYGLDILEKIRFNKYNKPFIFEAMEFNLSHAGDYVICAVSSIALVGIDIEEIKPINISDYHKIFNTEEISKFNKYPNIEMFYQLWTQKEAVLKAEGVGLIGSIEELIIHKNGEEALFKGKKWQLKELEIHPDYKTYLAYDTASKIDCSEVTFNEMVGFIKPL